MRKSVITILTALTISLLLTARVGATSLDELTNSTNVIEENTDGPHYFEGQEPVKTAPSSDDGLAEYMRGYKPITEENMQRANTMLSPLVRVIGDATGCLMVMTIALIFLITAVDLLYIAVPATRSYLNPSAMTLPQPMGMQMQQPVESGLKRKWVSDEASQVVAKYSGQSTQQMGIAQPMGMTMGMQPTQPVKIVVFEYLKMRAVFLVIFTVASILLLSSVFTDCGLNIAELGVKVIEKLNMGINNVQV